MTNINQSQLSSISLLDNNNPDSRLKSQKKVNKNYLLNKVR